MLWIFIHPSPFDLKKRKQFIEFEGGKCPQSFTYPFPSSKGTNPNPNTLQFTLSLNLLIYLFVVNNPNPYHPPWIPTNRIVDIVALL